MGFFDKYQPAAKPKTVVKKTATDAILQSINEQRRVLKGETVKRNSNPISSWENNGYISPLVLGLSLFGSGANTIPTPEGGLSVFLDDLEDGVKSGELKETISKFEAARKDRDERLERSRKQ